ncbi:MAG TPA: RNA-binding protein [Acidobacteriota bacterium]|nr:RNA-binding protein [Acidobacteriota bacterium]
MNSSKLYVGGLPYSISDSQLEELFSPHGTVDSARVITDRMTGRSKGFGFVEMSSPDEAQTGMDALNGTDLEGRSLVVNEARPREDRGGGGGGFGGGRNRGGGGGGGGGGRDRW